MTTNPSQPDPAPDRRRLWLRGLYLLLLASGVFAAWQAHELWWPAEERPAGSEFGPGGAGAAPRPLHTRPAPRPLAIPMPLPQSQPALALPGDAFPDAAVEGLDTDPVGVDPPPGATGLRAFALPASGVTAQYLWRGSVADAARHYEEALRDQECKLLESSTDPSGRQSLKFSGELRRVIVVLRPGPQEANIVNIEVTVIRLSR